MPSTVTELKQEHEYLQGIGIALSCDSGTIMVSTDCGVLTAQQAVSCLVAPEEGDRVLVAGIPDTDLFVIAVLDQPEKHPIHISMHGDCSVNISNGSLNLTAEEGLNLLSPKELGLNAADIFMRASRCNIVIDKLSYIGSRIFAQSEKIRLVGVFFDSVMERVAQRFKRCYRVVEEVDQLRSNEIEYRAEKNMSLRGQNTLIEAEDLVRLDGDQIHLG